MVPRVFTSSMPTCETNVLQQVVHALFGNRIGPLALLGGHRTQATGFREGLQSPRPNEFAQGHLSFADQLVEIVNDIGPRMAMILRDPRDVVVSLVHFRERLHDTNDVVSSHPNECEHTRTDRLGAGSLGFHHAGGVRPDFAPFARSFLPWEHWSGASCVQFEEHVDPLQQPVPLRRVYDELMGWREALERPPRRLAARVRSTHAGPVHAGCRGLADRDGVRT